MSDRLSPPPEPPPSSLPRDVVADTVALEQAVEHMASSIERSINDLNTGVIDLPEFRNRCLDAGIVRFADGVLIWDWVNSDIYLYDGLQVVRHEAAAQ